MAEEFKTTGNFSALYKVLQKLKACDEALERYERFEFDTNEAAFTDLRDSREVDQSWAIWMLRVIGSKMSKPLRQMCIAKITDPMQAFSVYLDCEWLTAEEDKLLEEKFKGKLPRAEQELRDGIVRRKKTEVSRG